MAGLTEAIFIGATIRGAEDGGTFLKPCEPGGNYNFGSPKYNAKLEELESNRASSLAADPEMHADCSAHRPCVGTLASVFVMNRHGDVLLQQTTKKAGQRCVLALPFINWLLENFRGQFASSLTGEEIEKQTLIFGFDVKEVIKIAAFEILGRNVHEEEVIDRIAVPVRLWHNPVGVYDPYDVLLSKTDKKDLDLNGLLRYFDVTATRDELIQDSQRQAEVAAQLVEAGQLVGALRT